MINKLLQKKWVCSVSSELIVVLFFLAMFFVMAGKCLSAPVNLIRLPLMTNPAIIDGSSAWNLTVEIAGNERLTVAALVDSAGKKYPLTVAMAKDLKEGHYDVSPTETKPEPGLYSLEVTMESGAADRQPRSVWILSGPPETLKFAVVSDTHVGDPRAGLSKSNITPTERRLKVLDAAVASGASFIIVTGDIVSVPGDYTNEYAEAYGELESRVAIPMFLAPGNHDLYTTTPKPSKADGLTFWGKYFGPLYYSFNIGKFAFIALDTYDWPVKFRNFMNSALLKQTGSYTEGAIGVEQFDWLKSVLKEDSTAGRTIVVFGHHNPAANLAQPEAGAVPGLASPDEVAKLLGNTALCFLAGHVHNNSETLFEKMKIITTVSASAQIAPGDSWGYRLCTIDAVGIECKSVAVVDQEK